MRQIVYRQNGFGLIEVLIALLVIMGGLLAVTGLQVDLFSESGYVKAHNEALELGREKIEQLRNNAQKGRFDADFLSISNFSTPEIVPGVNATFERSWNIAAEGSSGNLKKVIMKVHWTDDEGNGQDVLMNSLIVFSDPAKSIELVYTGSQGSESEAPSTSLSGQEGPSGIELDVNATNDVQIGVNIYSSKDADGNLIIYQGSRDMNNVVLTAFGGKLLKISGVVYFDLLVDKLSIDNATIKATSPSFCTTYDDPPSCIGLSGKRCKKYDCFVGGDCSQGGDGCPTECPTSTSNSTPCPYDDVNGGWYGKVGIFFPAVTANQTPETCMQDFMIINGIRTPNALPGTLKGLQPARLYVSERDCSVCTTGVTREGINQSFECHNMLVSNSKVCSGMVPDGTLLDIPDIAIYEIARPLVNTADNIVLKVDDYSYSKDYCRP